jgi:hypothetical protein
MKRRTSTTNPLESKHSDSQTLPDGRTISQGMEFHVKGQGRYVYAYQYTPDGEVSPL